MINLRKLSYIIFICFVISVSIWPLYALLFAFYLPRFPVPGYGKDNILFNAACWMALSYPAVIWLSSLGREFFLKVNREKSALLFSLLPLVNIIIVSGFYINGKIISDKTRADEIARTNQQFISGPRCPDGRRIVWNVPIKEREEIYISITERPASPSSSEGPFLYHMGYMYRNQFYFSRYTKPPGAPCFLEKSCLEYMNQCKDQNNRTIFDILKQEK